MNELAGPRFAWVAAWTVALAVLAPACSSSSAGSDTAAASGPDASTADDAAADADAGTDLDAADDAHAPLDGGDSGPGCPGPGWTPLDDPIPNSAFFGYNSSWGGPTFSMAAGQTYWLYMDPAAIGDPTGTSPTILVGDIAQAIPPLPSILHRLNDDCSFNTHLSDVPMSCPNCQCSPVWSKDEPYTAGEKMVIEVTPTQGIAYAMAYWRLN